MTQAIEFTKLPRRETPRLSWFGHLRARLFGLSESGGITSLNRCTPHLLRDIGLADDWRTNHLLRDPRLYRG